MLNFQNDIEKCLEVLKNGGLILYPTDTIWGIGCDATNSEAVEKIFKLKDRPDKKSMIILVAHEDDICNYAIEPNRLILDYLELADKPTTVIYRNAINLPQNLVNEDGTIAIRVVQDEFCNDMIQKFKKPIVSTSANISGQPSPKNFHEITDEIKNGVDYIVQHRQNDPGIYEPSSIIKFEGEKIIVIR